VPSWQTTVVPELGGTTTVVLAGGSGLELEMHPPSIDAAINTLHRIFIIRSCGPSMVGFSRSG
jgi:hypothetical protein